MELRPSEVRELGLGITTHRFEDHRLVIHTRGGEKYESANVSSRVYYENLEGINKILR